MQRCCNAGTEYADACRNNLNRTLVGSCSDMRARRQADGFGSLRASPSGHVVRGRGAIPRLDRRARDGWPSGRRHLLRNQKAREGPQVRILHHPQMAPAYVRCDSVSGPMREACWYRRQSRTCPSSSTVEWWRFSPFLARPSGFDSRLGPFGPVRLRTQCGYLGYFC